MPDLTVKVEGLNDLLKGANQRFPRDLNMAMNTSIKRATLGLLGATRVYITQVDAIDTGFLRGPGMKTTFAKLSGKLENEAPYAIFVHDGTSRMRPRPFFDEGIRAFTRSFEKIFQNGIDIALNKAFQ